MSALQKSIKIKKTSKSLSEVVIFCYHHKTSQFKGGFRFYHDFNVKSEQNHKAKLQSKTTEQNHRAETTEQRFIIIQEYESIVVDTINTISL